jgi:hypothetical protein
MTSRSTLLPTLRYDTWLGFDNADLIYATIWHAKELQYCHVLGLGYVNHKTWVRIGIGFISVDDSQDKIQVAY